MCQYLHLCSYIRSILIKLYLHIVMVFLFSNYNMLFQFSSFVLYFSVICEAFYYISIVFAPLISVYVNVLHNYN